MFRYYPLRKEIKRVMIKTKKKDKTGNKDKIVFHNNVYNKGIVFILYLINNQ
jgi:hypothetical protein